MEGRQGPSGLPQATGRGAAAAPARRRGPGGQEHDPCEDVTESGDGRAASPAHPGRGLGAPAGARPGRSMGGLPPALAAGGRATRGGLGAGPAHSTPARGQHRCGRGPRHAASARTQSAARPRPAWLYPPGARRRTGVELIPGSAYHAPDGISPGGRLLAEKEQGLWTFYSPMDCLLSRRALVVLFGSWQLPKAAQPMGEAMPSSKKESAEDAQEVILHHGSGPGRQPPAGCRSAS